MPSTIPDAVINKYIKIKALAEKGESGERENARTMMQKFEREHPGIAFAAMHKEQEATQPDHSPSSSDSWWPDSNSNSNSNSNSTTQSHKYHANGQNPDSSFVGNWEKLFEFASTMWGSASEFANSISEAALGSHVAEEVDVNTKITSANNVIVTIKMPLSIYEFVLRMNDTQKLAFRRRLHEILDAELQELIEG